MIYALKIKLLHDIKAKCASLNSAAKLLGGSPPGEAKELLSLMAKGAGELADALARLRGRL